MYKYFFILHVAGALTAFNYCPCTVRPGQDRDPSCEKSSTNALNGGSKTEACTVSEDCSGRNDIIIPAKISKFIRKNYPDYRVARNADFCDDWCMFYPEDKVPYFTSGDYNGDGNTEYAAILTTPYHFRTLLILIEKNLPFVLDTLSFNTAPEKRDSLDNKFIYGLYTEQPSEVYDFLTGNTFHVSAEYISLCYFEKAAESYFWTGKGYKKVLSAD